MLKYPDLPFSLEVAEEKVVKKLLVVTMLCLTAREVWRMRLKKPFLRFSFKYCFGESPEVISKSEVEDVLGGEWYLYFNREQGEFQVKRLGKLADYFGFEGTNYLKSLNFPPKKTKH